MTGDNRQFCASISVRFDTTRTKIELSPAALHSGPAGCYRARINRRWFDRADGSPLFLDREQVAALAAELATGGTGDTILPPVLPVGSCVRVYRGKPGLSTFERGFVKTEPFQAHDGIWYVAVFVFGDVKILPVADLVRKA